MSIGLIRSALTHLGLKKSGKRRHSEKGKEEGQDVGLSIRSVPLGFCPRESSVRGALWGPVLESHRIEQQPGPWITEGLSWPHLCQERAFFVPNFGLNLIPRWLGHFGEHSSGPFGLMIGMEAWFSHKWKVGVCPSSFPLHLLQALCFLLMVLRGPCGAALGVGV